MQTHGTTFLKKCRALIKSYCHNSYSIIQIPRKCVFVRAYMLIDRAICNRGNIWYNVLKQYYALVKSNCFASSYNII